MNFALIINQILTLFIIIFIGYILQQKGYIDKKIEKGLSRLLLKVVLPALIISSMIVEIDAELIDNIILMTIISFLSYFFLILFSKILMKILNVSVNRKVVFQFLLIFSNVGYMGYPVVDAVFPEYGIFYAVFNNIVFGIILWTYGVYLFNSEKDDYKIKWKNIFNNGVIASIIGLILLLTSYKPPEPIMGALNYISNMTFPLSMFIIGASLAKVNFKSIIKDKLLFFVTVLRLLVLPISLYMILLPFDIPEIILIISVLLVAMPSAANTVIFAEEYEGNSTFASEAVFLTTLFSLFTIPLILYLIT
ncbi:MAG: AEC family transporter [Bacillota bacterium]